MSQEYVIGYYWFPNQTNPSYIVMRVFGEDRIKQYNLQPNDEVRVRFHCEAHESNGRWYNELRIDGGTFVGGSAGKNQQASGQTAGNATQNGVGQGSGGTAVGQPQQGIQGTVQGDAGGEMNQMAQVVQAGQVQLTEEQKKAMAALNNIGNGESGDLPF
jgi:hypothetical protein